MFQYKDDIFYPYLYFNVNAGTEYLFLAGRKLEEETYFFMNSTDIVQDSVPIGSILCKSLNLLTDIFSYLDKTLEFSDEYIQKAKHIKQLIRSKFLKNKVDNASDKDLMLLMEMAFCCDAPEQFDMDSLEFNQFLNYFNFAKLCAENKKYHTVEQLFQLSNLIGHKLKNGFLLTNNIPNFQIESKLTMWEIKMWLDRQQEDMMDPRYYELYGVNSLADLIAISLHRLCLSKRSISRCRICGRYFIPKKAGTLYCNKPNPKYNNRTCREEAKLQKQLKRTQMSESQRLHRSVAQMLRARVYAEQFEYAELTNFLDKSKAFRMQVKNGQVAEWEYIKWLQ